MPQVTATFFIYCNVAVAKLRDCLNMSFSSSDSSRTSSTSCFLHIIKCFLTHKCFIILKNFAKLKFGSYVAVWTCVLKKSSSVISSNMKFILQECPQPVVYFISSSAFNTSVLPNLQKFGQTYNWFKTSRLNNVLYILQELSYTIIWYISSRVINSLVLLNCIMSSTTSFSIHWFILKIISFVCWWKTNFNHYLIYWITMELYWCHLLSLHHYIELHHLKLTIPSLTS